MSKDSKRKHTSTEIDFARKYITEATQYYGGQTVSKDSKRKRSKVVPPATADQADTEPDWSNECENCGAKPIVPATGMCGPCTFGEADTADGNW